MKMPAPTAVLPALAVLLALPLAAAAQQSEPRLPRIIYGQEATEPRVLYGEPTPAPEPPRPRAPAPQAAQPLPAPSSGTSIVQGWVPLGPPRWEPWPDHRPPLGHHPRWRALPEPAPRDTRFESPLPMGSYLGRPPSAALPQAPTYGRPGR